MNRIIRKIFICISVAFSCYIFLVGIEKLCIQEAMPSKAKNGLTYEEIIEDYNYYWDSLKSSNLTIASSDISGIYNKYLYKVNQLFSKEDLGKNIDFEFYEIMEDCSKELINFGHVDLVNCEEYIKLLQLYSQYPERNAWYKELSNKSTNQTYNSWSKIMPSPNISAIPDSHVNNINQQIIIKNKIAYVKINSFDNQKAENDKEILIKFYNEIQDYEHLIIDITGNGGGSTNYFMYNIVLPNLKTDLSYTYTKLFMKSKNNSKYMSSIEDIESIAKFPLETYPNVDKRALELSTHFASDTLVYEKIAQPLFNGQIWVLIDEYCYSSADAFASFCKFTNFATLIGYTTAGNGAHGIDPVLLTLPNSKLIVRYSIDYNLNIDGTNNAKIGTTPDIQSINNESPLDTCLEEINSQKVIP